MSTRDVLELKRPGSLSWAPIKNTAAYIVQSFSIERNERTASLFTMKPGQAPQVIASAEAISPPQWSADGRSLSYVTFERGAFRAWSARSDGSGTQELLRGSQVFGAGVDSENLDLYPIFRLSPDGRYAAVLHRDTQRAMQRLNQMYDEDWLYTDSNTALDFLDLAYGAKRMPAAPPELLVIDLQTGGQRAIWRPNVSAKEIGFDIWFDWAPDGKTIGLTWTNLSDPKRGRTQVSILRMAGETIEESGLSLAYTLFPRWQADGYTLTVFSQGPVDSSTDAEGAFSNYDLDTRSMALKLAPQLNDGRKDAVAARELSAQSDAQRRDCVRSNDGTTTACILEGSTVPPDVQMFSTKAAGRSVWNADLNQVLSRKRFGRVEVIGEAIPGANNSAIIYPASYEPGKKYPLVVMEYNLHSSGRFTGYMYFRNYAPQVFSARGYFVVLHNMPEDWQDYGSGNFSEALANEIGKPEKALKEIIASLDRKGAVDMQRIGIMGWSKGGFIAPALMLSDPAFFRAGAAGDSCNNMPAGYWIFSSTWKAQESRFFGLGGPWGANSENWRKASPYFNYEKLEAPLLLEFSRNFLCGIDNHSRLEDLGKASELHIYRNEAHVFARPKNILSSMERHLDWFDFWLKGEEHPTSDHAQYVRWRALCGRSARFGARCNPSIPSASTR